MKSRTPKATSMMAWFAACFIFGMRALAQSVPAATPPLSRPTSAPAGSPAQSPAAQPAEEAKITAPFLDMVNNDRLTGDWGGVRTKLEEKGITLNLTLTSIYQQNAHGGVRTYHGHDTTGKADTELTLDSAAMGLWKGGTLYVFSESAWNDAIDDRVGGLSSVNGDAIGDRSIRVRELWYEQKVLDDQIPLSVRISGHLVRLTFSISLR